MIKYKTVKPARFISFALLICILFHYCCGDFFKSIIIIPDELRYYEIAKSLYLGNGISYRGVPFDFQKILYSLVILPVFSVSNNVIRLKLINMINSILVSLGIIPTFLICRKIKLDDNWTYLVCLIAGFCPGTMSSMTFMTETLYWPLFLAFCYLFISHTNEIPMRTSVIAAVVCYLGYMTKEIFLALFLSYIFVEILYIVRDWYKDKIFNKKKFISIVAFTGTFIIFHLLLKLTLFKGMGNSYDQMGLDALNGVYGLCYLFYSFFYSIAGVLITLGVIPFIVTIMCFRSIDSTYTRLSAFIYGFFIISAGTVAYTISIREDYGRLAPSFHLRYFEPGLIIVMALFCRCMQNGVEHIKIREKSYIAYVLGGLTIAIFRGQQKSIAFVSDYSLKLYRFIFDYLKNRYFNLKEDKTNMSALVINLLIIMLILCYFLLVYLKKAKVANSLYLSLLIFTVISWDLLARRIDIQFYSISKDEVIEIVKIDNFFRDLNGKVNVLYLTDSNENNNASEKIDTYLCDKENYSICYCRDDMFADYAKGDYNVSSIEFRERIWQRCYDRTDRIDFVILEVRNEDRDLPIAGLELVDGIGGNDYYVYKNVDSEMISF